MGGRADRRRARRVHRHRRDARRASPTTVRPARRGAPPRAAPSARSPSAPAARSCTRALERAAGGRAAACTRRPSVPSLAAREAEERRDAARGRAARAAPRHESEALESARRCRWLIDQRREHGVGPGGRPPGRAERRDRGRAAAGRAARARARGARRAPAARSRRSSPATARWCPSAERAAGGDRGRARGGRSSGATRSSRSWRADEAVGEGVAAELRELATAGVRAAGAAARGRRGPHARGGARGAGPRPRVGARAASSPSIGERLGLELEARPEPLAEEERDELAARLERLERRRERLGPVNPLAEREYEEALAHVEELEGQRKDLEAALAELRGLIRETDRLIRESFDETFEAAARNFEDVIAAPLPRRPRPPAPRAAPARPAPGARRRGRAAGGSRGVGLRPAGSGENRRPSPRQTRPRACPRTAVL